MVAAATYDTKDGNPVIYRLSTLEVYGEAIIAGMADAVPGRTATRTGLQFRFETCHHPLMERFC